MGKHRKRRPQDPRPLHGYGLELENDRHVAYNYRINTIAWSILFGPVIVLTGIGLATAPSEVIGGKSDADTTTVHWAGVAIAIGAGLYFLAGVYLAVRGLIRWARHRKRYKAAMAIAVAEYEAREA